MLNFGAPKPRVKGGPGPLGPPGSAPEMSAVYDVFSCHRSSISVFYVLKFLS